MPAAAATTITTTPPPIAYAAAAWLTLETRIDALTAAFLADLDAQVSADCACDAGVVAVTHDNVTTFCTASGGGCTNLSPPHTRRRLLLAADTTTVVVEFTLLTTSSSSLTHAPKPPTCGGQTVVAWEAYECQPITDPALVRDRRRLAVHFKRTGRPWVLVEQSDTSWQQYYLAIGIIVLIAAFALLGGGGAVYYVYEVDTGRGGGGGYGERKYQQVNIYHGKKFEAAERELLLPEGWGT